VHEPRERPLRRGDIRGRAPSGVAQAAILTLCARTVWSLGDSKPHQDFANPPADRSEHEGRPTRCHRPAWGPDGAIRRCLDLANTLQDPKGRAALLQMAQVWLRLAQRHVEEETSDQLNR
jgi:hypothetical protein